MVHSVMLKKASGYNLLTVEDYFAIPLGERVDLLLSQKIQFLNEAGDVLPLKEAIKSLRQYEVANNVRRIA